MRLDIKMVAATIDDFMEVFESLAREIRCGWMTADLSGRDTTGAAVIEYEFTEGYSLDEKGPRITGE